MRPSHIWLAAIDDLELKLTADERGEFVMSDKSQVIVVHLVGRDSLRLVSRPCPDPKVHLARLGLLDRGLDRVRLEIARRRHRRRVA